MNQHKPEAHVWLIVAGAKTGALYRSYSCCTIARNLDAPGEGSISRQQTMTSTCLELVHGSNLRVANKPASK